MGLAAIASSMDETDSVETITLKDSQDESPKDKKKEQDNEFAITPIAAVSTSLNNEEDSDDSTQLDGLDMLPETEVDEQNEKQGGDGADDNISGMTSSSSLDFEDEKNESRYEDISAHIERLRKDLVDGRDKKDNSALEETVPYNDDEDEDDRMEIEELSDVSPLPEEAEIVNRAARFEESQLLRDSDFEGSVYPELANSTAPIPDWLLDELASKTSVVLLRIRDHLDHAGIKTIGDICSMSRFELFKTLPIDSRGLGKTVMFEQTMKKYQVCLQYLMRTQSGQNSNSIVSLMFPHPSFTG